MKPNSSIGIDEYIGSFPSDTQELLRQLRDTIRETAPEAEEVIHPDHREQQKIDFIT